METRIGNQIPTQSRIIPYTKTYGQDAIDIYNSTGRTAQEWQELLLSDILAYNDENLYVHTKFGLAVSRRNGKNEVVTIREMWGLQNGEHILHTAHRTTTTHVAWERLYDLLCKANIGIVSSYRAYGKEHIEISNGARIEFRTRTAKGGLGEGYDLLVIDEAQEYQDDQESALKYVVSDSKNPQTIFCGTPPTTVSSGTVFTKYRDATLQGEGENAGWSEWSVEKMSDPNDKELWYLTNPSLGTILTERKIQDEIGNDDLDFNIQRLGLWIKYSLKSEISSVEWDKLKITQIPKFKGKLFVGVKYGYDGTNVALSIAVKTNEDKIFVESIDCRSVRSGNTWILEFIKNADVQKVVVDGASGQNILANEMKDYGLKPPVLPTVKEVITANSVFEQALYSDTIRHNNQPSLTQVVTNCEKRAIGTGGGFSYKSIKAESDIALMHSMIFALWACSTAKEPVKQKITY
ncbi:MAG: hypothetical protein KBT03_07600 [Bacteroidales bacterium]|nr:hypothetical protein [Candidatus Scybalousia scybalohippi]